MTLLNLVDKYQSLYFSAENDDFNSYCWDTCDGKYEIQYEVLKYNLIQKQTNNRINLKVGQKHKLGEIKDQKLNIGKVRSKKQKLNNLVFEAIAIKAVVLKCSLKEVFSNISQIS